MSSIDRLKKQLDEVDKVTGYYNMTPGQLFVWKTWRKEQLKAEIGMHNFLNSLLPKPLPEEIRHKLTEEGIDQYLSVTTGDGMDRDRAEAEISEMSDWEFVQNFQVDMSKI